MAVGAGVTLGSRYQLISEIGGGGMGSVWSAKRIDLDAIVAVKLMKGDVPPKTEALERFRREAKAAAALRGPHVVQILDYGVDEASGVPFIAMELLEGESLRQRLDAAKRLTPAQTASIITQAARGLSRAHAAGIIHRDLKPENVFLVANEDTELVKLLDFGIAKAELHSGQFSTATGTVIGTPHYMSPEQLEPSRRVDYRTDIWSLGIIAAECLIGQRPFDADTLQELAMKICLGRSRLPSAVCPVPVGFDAFFAQACAVDPESRFASAAELARALSDVCGGALTAPPRAPVADLGATVRLDSTGGAVNLNLARPAGATEQLPPPAARARWGWGVLVAVVLALAGGALAVKMRLGASSAVASPAAASSTGAAPADPAPTGSAPPSASAASPLPPTAPGTTAAPPLPAAPAAPLEGLPTTSSAEQKPELPAAATKNGVPRRSDERRRDVRRTPAASAPVDAFDLQ
ncbi:MAG TPA: serine/threonine-protein kinase [Polyangiaceae bacterium]|nr:serine/threonine-protein kinase [Polyangiaceae bacterium]